MEYGDGWNQAAAESDYSSVLPRGCTSWSAELGICSPFEGPVRTNQKPGCTLAAGLAILILAACQVQWVSPYSADLQKKATDMLAEVVAWENHMLAAAGTAAADPRNPDVQATLERWHGEIEAMSEIELGIDHGSTVCDKFLAAIGGSIPGTLKKVLPDAPAAGGSETKPISHCETLPGIFTRMKQQVTGSAADAPGIPFILDQQCKLPWLSDEYFKILQEGRATAGASSPARPASAGAKAGTPSKAQEVAATAQCRSLFEPPSGAAHGNLLTPLVVDLDAIIYREGRQAPPSTM